MSNLTIQQRTAGDITILDLHGKVTLGETNRQLHQALKALVEGGVNKIILNLEKVKAVDSSGLGEIVAGYSTLKAHGGELILINMPDKVLELMTITKLYTVFNVYDTEAEGLAEFKKKSVTTQRPDEAFPVKAKTTSSIH